MFPTRKRDMVRKIKEINGFRVDVRGCVSQGIPQIEHEIAENSRFRMEARLALSPDIPLPSQ